MALQSAEAVLLFDFFFIMLLATYGAGVSGVNFSSLTNLPPPPISQFPSVNCSGLCAPFSGIVQATAYVGWAIVNIPVVIGYIIVVSITFLNIVLLITFSQGLSANGVPVVGFFFLALQLFIGLKVVTIFRGAATGL